ncbi:hypothetical protein FB451DRAFT_1288115 [Mycena latifolia]|nr:hypothetical protein FB451DRAFT_1288115 [Mycena latifolia]
MHIPFTVFLSLALALPTLAAPMVYGNNTEVVSAPTPEQRVRVLGPLPTGIVEDESALEARKAKAKVTAKKPVAVKKPVKVPAKPKAAKTTAKKGKYSFVPPSENALMNNAKAGKTTVKKPTATKVPAKTGKTPVKTPGKTPVKPVNGMWFCVPRHIFWDSATCEGTKTATKKPGARIKARANVRHPSGTGNIILFHGTSPTGAAALEAQGVDLSKTASRGDFSHRPESDGGFYMTDSLIAAAQFACHEHTIPRGAEVDVLGIMSVKAFPSANAEFDDFLEYNEGPDTDSEDVPNEDDPFHVDLNKVLFHQYAVIKQAAADSNLVLTTRHRTIFCKNVPKKTALTAEMYTNTQGGNANFATAVAALQDPDGCA